MNKEIKWGIVLQYVQMVLSIVIHLFYTPIMIKLLGQSEYGLYNLVSSIISYLSLLSLGFGAGYIRFYSRYKGKNDEQGIKKLNGLYLSVFSIIGVVSLIAGLVIAFNSGIFFNETYSAADLEIAKTLMIYLSINLALSFPASVFVSYISSQEKFIFQKLLNIGKTILSPCLCVAVMYLGYGSIGMVITTTVISVAIDLFNVLFCVTKLKMRFLFGKPDWHLFREILVFSVFIAINQIVDQVNTQTDKIILGKMINSAAVATYAVASTIQSMYTNLSASVSGIFTTRVHRIMNDNLPEQDKRLTDLFVKIGRIQYFILMLIQTGFIFFGQYFIKLWAGEEYTLAYFIILILMIPSTVPLIQNVGIEIQRAKNKHQYRSIIYIIVAVANVIISIILCKYYGIIGVAIGTLISNLVGTILLMNIFYHIKIKINILRFWWEILKASVGLIIPCVFGALIMLFIPFTSFKLYFGMIIAYSVVYLISIYFLGLNKEEKQFVKGEISKMLLLFAKIYYFVMSRLFCKKRVLFMCFTGEQYSDNPKAISEYLHKQNPKIKQLWFCKNVKELEKIVPKYVKCIKYSRFTYLHYVATSRILIDNNWLVTNHTLTKMPKSNKQIFIETWHGDRGMKKCFYAVEGYTQKVPFALEKQGLIDYIVTGSKYAEGSNTAMFKHKCKYLKVGSPRNDVLFNDSLKNKKETEVKEKLGLANSTKILLYAPTFRQNIPDNLESIDLQQIAKKLEEKTKQKWAVVFRAHHINNGTHLGNFYDGRTLFNDMSDLLCASDMLITDYSSSAGDFALTGKPILLYVNDYNEYSTKDRGTFFDLEKSPYWVAKNNDEAIKLIEELTPEKAKQNCREILKFYGSYEDGTACKQIYELILNNFNKKKEKN